MHALPETIAALRTHIFNGVIQPDFTRLPSAERPMLQRVPCAVGDVLAFGTRRVEVLSAAHTVAAVGFAVDIDPADAAAGAWGRHRRHRPEPAAVAAAARVCASRTW